MASFTVESWTWYGFVVVMVALRFFARLMHFKSIRQLQVEDWLMLLLTCLYTILIVFLNIDATVETNLINPADIPHLTAHDIAMRTWGSKTVLLVEQCMCAVQWGTKTCLLILYWRLTQNLAQNRMVKWAGIYVGVTYAIMEILYFAVWCRPFHDYWQTPTTNTQCTTAEHHLILNMVFNLSSDLLIMSIPLPLLLKTHLEWKRKVLLTLPFTMGSFTIICAILSKHLTFTQPFSADWVFWYCRESSTAMIVANMPYTWTLIRRVFKLKSFLGESDDQSHPPVILRGVSMHVASNGSSAIRAKNRASWLFHGRKHEKNSTGGVSEHRLEPWQDVTDPRDDKSIIITTPEPGSSSSGNSLVKLPQTPDNTQATLDKLYPLDDLDLEVVEQRRAKVRG